MKINRLTFAAVVAVVASSANAVILVPDVFTALPGTLTPGGTVVEDVLQPFSFAANGGTMTGTVQEIDSTLILKIETPFKQDLFMRKRGNSLLQAATGGKIVLVPVIEFKQIIKP